MKHKKYSITILVIFFIATLTASVLLLKNNNFHLLTKQTIPPYEKEFATLFVNKIELQVEVADTKEKRSKGLSGRKQLKENRGMLFVFDTPEIYYFWMKNMLFPIDILWISETGEILGTEESFAPDSYPLTVAPDTPIKYALEINTNFIKKHNIKNGDFVNLPFKN